MLYQSRLQVGIVEDPFITLHTQQDSNKRTSAGTEKGTPNSSRANRTERIDDDDGGNVDDEITSKLDPKQRLALTVRNWSVIPENDEHVLNEGAIEALIALSALEDVKIKKACSGAFYHLSRRERNRAKLISLGAVAGIVSVVNVGGISNWDVAKYSKSHQLLIRPSPYWFHRWWLAGPALITAA